jgi:uracil-DNA glycosylase
MSSASADFVPEVNEKFVREALGLLDDGLWVTPFRVEVLAKITAIYRAEGVLVDEFAPALHRACPNARGCWAGAEHRMAEGGEVCGPSQPGSIFWPWVGESYRPGGVCLVAWNINYAGDWWSIAEEYAIARAKFNELAAGRRASRNGSKFGYRSSAAAMAALASRDGETAVVDPDARAAPAALERVAMIQAVKCSPLGSRGNPTPTMNHACPSRFAVPEVAVLAPSVIVALGADARSAIEQCGPTEWDTRHEDYRRGRVQVDHEDYATLVSLPHPQAFGRAWPRGLALMVDDLNTRPLRQCPGKTRGTCTSVD